MFENMPPELGQAAPGAVGSAIALRWLPGNWIGLAGSWLAGSALAFLVSPGLAEAFNITSTGKINLLRVAIGLVGILILAKVVELIQSLDVRQISAAVVNWIRKRLGQEPREPTP